jgi:uncharacterized protein (TIGR01370 family)
MHSSIDPEAEGPAVEARNDALSGVASWVVQDAARTAILGPEGDLAVVPVGHAGATLSIDGVMRLRIREGQADRVVLARIELSEIAETSEVWQADWVVDVSPAGAKATFPRVPRATAPAWLGRENATRRTTYPVRFWHPDWQARLSGSSSALLDRVIAAGFDGIYLVGSEAARNWSPERSEARADMIDLIGKLADYGRRLRPELVIVLENGDDLVNVRKVRGAIDGLALTGLLYPEGLGGESSPDDIIESRLLRLRPLQIDARPIFVREAVEDERSAVAVASRLRRLGLVPSIAVRDSAR